MIFYLVATLGILLGIAYVVLILVYIKNWNALSKISLPNNYKGKTSITVIIPIRNEADNIIRLLKSILENKYDPSLIEIIIVDDHSTDNSIAQVHELENDRIKVLALANYDIPSKFKAFKKFGIEEAVKIAKGDLILTTDGDCIVPKNWLNYFAYMYEIEHKKFIAAPVNFEYESQVLHAFQCLDFMGMMIVTGANIERKKSMLCNGANMGYCKELFMSLGGYAGLTNQASGDDVMLLNKVAEKDPELVGFVKNRLATVHTKACDTWGQLWQQRLRWATKNSSSKDFGLKLELGIVYLASCLLIILIVMYAINLKFIYIFFFLFLCIFAINYVMLRTASKFFAKEKQLEYFRSSFWIHLFYIIIIGTASLFQKEYIWKGRKVS